jgi:putative ABC transport system permease protein
MHRLKKYFAPALMSVQVAISLAILTNASTFVLARLLWTSASTGADESHLFYLWAENVNPVANMAAEQTNDIGMLRSMDGVDDAFPTNQYPLAGGGYSTEIDLSPGQHSPTAMASFYFVDDHGLRTLGLRLISGRNFQPSEIVERKPNEPAAGYIVTAALARQLFPQDNALGKSIYVDKLTQAAPIIGIVERLQGPFVDSTGFFGTFVENSVLAPYRFIDDTTTYVVRTKRPIIIDVMRNAENSLRQVNGARIVSSKSMLAVREAAYGSARTLAIMLALVVLILIAVNAFGIFGLTSFWVSQRTRQIGIRRALGANKSAIVRFFQRENALMVLSGVVIGIVLAFALNTFIAQKLEIVRMKSSHLIVSSCLLLVLGQVAAVWPALRASRISPASAMRGG